MADKILDELVKQLQEHINSVGGKLVVDGKMGEKTYNAIFLRQNGPAKAGVRQDWRLAISLVRLRTQVNEAYPARAKDADGTIGDAAHQKRTSDHNPWVRDDLGQPIVTALDITHDPKDGVDCFVIANAIKTDPRVKYIIWDGKIWNPTKKLSWVKYTGANPHTHHMHVSVKEEQIHFDSTVAWRIK